MTYYDMLRLTQTVFDRVQKSFPVDLDEKEDFNRILSCLENIGLKYKCYNYSSIENGEVRG